MGHSPLLKIFNIKYRSGKSNGNADGLSRQAWTTDNTPKYKLGYVKRGSTAFKVLKDGCGIPSAARALLGPEGLLMR